MSRGAGFSLVTLAALLGAAVGGFVASLRSSPPRVPPLRQALSISIPTDRELLDIAVSADASRIAYTAIVDGRSRLYVAVWIDSRPRRCRIRRALDNRSSHRTVKPSGFSRMVGSGPCRWTRKEEPPSSVE